MSKYVTKSEFSMSHLLKVINEQTSDLSQLKRLDALSAVLDKHRECSVQEAVYRLLGLPMTRSSVKVKYISTIHPHHRDGLLKKNIEDLKEDESVFHMSPHQYYEAGPGKSMNMDTIEYHQDELKDD